MQAGISNVSAATTTAPSVAIQPGGTLVYARGSEIPSLDPINLQNSGTADTPAAFATFDMLVYSDNGSVVGKTAESLTSSDALTWTLKLRPNIKFTDGTAYDAAAVKFNWARLQDPNNHAAQASKANLIATMDVVDNVTLRIVLKSKNATFPQAVVFIPFIGSPQAIQRNAADFSNNPIGAGPFVLKSWVRDSQMTFDRNPGYWDSPRPYVDHFINKVIPDDSQRMNSFCAGEANMTFTALAASIDTVQRASCNNPVVTYLATNGGALMLMNNKKPPFNDLRVRQGIVQAIDTADLSKVVTNGATPPKRSMFLPESPFADPTIQQLPYDPAKAQQLFDQAAADLGGPITFTIASFGVNYHPLLAQYFQSKLNQYKNVKVSVDVQATANVITNAASGNFQMLTYAFLFNDPEPALTGQFLCSTTGWTGFCDQAFDSAVAANQQALDPKQRIDAVKQFQKVFYQDAPGAWTMDLPVWNIAASNVQGFHRINDNFPLIDQMWIKTR